MANAKKCDVCGKLYEMYGVKNLNFFLNVVPNESNEPNGIDLVCIDEKGDANCIKELDLCPECMKKVQSLLKKIKEDSKQ